MTVIPVTGAVAIRHFVIAPVGGLAMHRPRSGIFAETRHAEQLPQQGAVATERAGAATSARSGGGGERVSVIGTYHAYPVVTHGYRL